MFRFLVILALMLPGFAYGYECNKEIDKLSEEYKIKIICKNKSIIDSGMDFKFVEADQDLIDNSYNGIKLFLSSYDKNFLRLRTKTINLFKNIVFVKSSVGGLNHGGHIWLCLGYFSRENIDKIYQKILHHEFSSNIYKSVNFDSRYEWKNINPIYEYSISFLKKCLNDIKFCNSSSEKILNDGFLINYSLTDDENDFNTYAEILFVETEYMKETAQKYLKVNNKLQKFKEFYKDTGFIGKFPDEP